MTEDQKISALRVMLGENSRTRRPEEEAVLTTYLDMAAAKILERLYPFVEDYTTLPGGREYDAEGNVVKENPYPVPAKYHQMQIKIAVYLLNKRGAEGEVQHIENGTHRNYGDADIPEAMLDGMAPFVGFPK